MIQGGEVQVNGEVETRRRRKLTVGDVVELEGRTYSPNEFPSGNDEAAYICGSCGEEIVIPLDLSAGKNQNYVEDCPVCCRANVIHVEIDEDGGTTVWAEPEQG